MEESQCDDGGKEGGSEKIEIRCIKKKERLVVKFSSTYGKRKKITIA